METFSLIPQLRGTSVALGYFDGCHLGHLSVINAAKADDLTLCVLSVGRPYYIERSGSAVETRLIPPSEERRILDAQGVSYFIRPPFHALQDMRGEEFFREILVGALGAKRVVCGVDFRFGSGASCGADDLRRMAEQSGVECVVCPEICADGQKISSTRIRELLSDGSIPAVNRMLGRNYGYNIPVVHGMCLARTLDAPTINQPLPPCLFPLRRGVYASRVLLDGEWHCGVTNIGVKPTISGSEERLPLSETWVLGYSGNLYGQNIRTELLAFLRDERRFGSLDELRRAIHADAEMAKSLFAESSSDGSSLF